MHLLKYTAKLWLYHPTDEHLGTNIDVYVNKA